MGKNHRNSDYYERKMCMLWKALPSLLFFCGDDPLRSTRVTSAILRPSVVAAAEGGATPDKQKGKRSNLTNFLIRASILSLEGEMGNS